MRRNQSTIEDFVDIMSKLPWWVNIILALISYSVLHKMAMSFQEPPPKLEVGQLGDFIAGKLPGAIALFGQFVMPFALIFAGLVGLIKKFKRTGQYKELIFYVAINILFFGPILSKEGGFQNSIKNRIENPTITNKTVQPTAAKKETNQSSESENEVKALQGILEGINGKKVAAQEEVKVYSWINEKGQKIYSNHPQK